MDQETFAGYVARLGEINNVLAGLDPAIRADAYELLKPYVTGESPPAKRVTVPQAKNPAKRPPRTTARTAPPEVVAPITEDEERLVETHLSDGDADNALLSLAILYSRHGRGPFAMAQIKAIAAQFRLNIPARPDKFFSSAKRGEPATLIARKQADGWKIQPSADTWLKNTYGVTLGREPFPGVSA